MIHLKRIPLILCAILVVVSTVLGQTGDAAQEKSDPKKPQTWMTYTLKGAEFAVALPARPAISSTRTFHRPKQRTLLGQLVNTRLGDVVYSVELFENFEPMLSLDEFVAEETTESRFDVTTEKKLTVQGFAGKEFSSLSTSPPATVQFFATEKRLYRFSVTGADAKHEGGRRFFSSIQLGPQVTGIVVPNPFEIDGERIYVGTEVDSKIRLLTKPEPQYTEDARRERISGTVVIKAVFSATGYVTNIRVVSGLPYGLTERAIAAAKKIKFTPAMKDGKPVSMWIQLEYNFNP